ncbi:MAG: hypothetical protein AAF515_03465 [Pseudomonadota bacterium]
MAIELTQNAIDLGIVVKDADAMVVFYRDVVGLVEEPASPFPGGGTTYSAARSSPAM